MYKIAVVGDRDTILGFKAAGFEVYEAADADKTRRTVDSLAKNGYGVIFITERAASLIPETISRYDREPVPAVILIPDTRGSLNTGMDRIAKNVEKAVGTNIL